MLHASCDGKSLIHIWNVAACSQNLQVVYKDYWWFAMSVADVANKPVYFCDITHSRIVDIRSYGLSVTVPCFQKLCM